MDPLLFIQIILETGAAVAFILGVVFALIGWKVNRTWYIAACGSMYMAAIIWLINSVVEYFMQIWTSMYVTVLLVIIAWFLGMRCYKAAVADDNVTNEAIKE